MLSAALAFFALLPSLGTQSAVHNPGFESAPVLTGWEVETRLRQDHGRTPTLTADPNDAREGAQSLLIEALDPADASVKQRIFLPVGTLWRASVWIKTENLESGEGGVIAIDTPGAEIASSVGRSSTTPWKDEEVTFRVPSPGYIDLTLVGVRGGTGRVWFDDVRLESLPSDAREDVHIFAEHATKRPIDAKQQGQFIELLCNLIPTIISQQVVSTSFEDAPPCHADYKKEVDEPYRPWYPDGAVQVAKYSFDTTNPFSGARSQKIVLPAAHARAGISQGGFYLKQGVSYKLRLHLRGDGNVPVWASLHGGGRIIAGPVLLGRASENWAAAEAELRADRTTDNATLTIDFEGPGTLWLDRVYMIGSDAVLGIWRPEVVAALKAMHPGIIRFGGSTTEEYEWDRAIGPWDDRLTFTTVWGGWEENFVGIDEFVRLCEYIGAEPLVCVRWTGKKPEDAAAEVEYANGSTETRWGALRARNGHPAPYHVKYWQIGNEVDVSDYGNSVRAFAEAMKKADPSIKLMSSFPTKGLLDAAGTIFDYLCPHLYEVNDIVAEESSFKHLGDWIAANGGGKDIRVGVTEWNTTAGNFGLERGMLQTLGNALSISRFLNLMQRYADLVEIANRSNFADSRGSGFLVTGPGWIYESPAYYAQQMYSRATGAYPLRVECSSKLAWHLQEPDLSASVSADGKKLRIYAVNSTLDPLPRNFELGGFKEGVVGGTVTTLEDHAHAGTSEVMNSRDEPQRISVVSRPADLRGARFDFTFSPLTITLLELDLRP
jgi:alpha-L-arabinofuranosidase